MYLIGICLFQAQDFILTPRHYFNLSFLSMLFCKLSSQNVALLVFYIFKKCNKIKMNKFLFRLETALQLLIRAQK